MSEPERDPVSAPSQTPGLSTSRELLFGLLTLVVFYGVLEGFARIAAPVVMGDTYGAPSALDRGEADGWIVDPVLGWSMVPGDSRSRGGATATTNSRGFRGPDFDERKRNGTLRVVAVGDSTVMGYGVEQHDTFTEQLRSDLASQTDRDVEVVNLGTPGYTSEQARLLLELHMNTLEPDVICSCRTTTIAAPSRPEPHRILAPTSSLWRSRPSSSRSSTGARS